MKSKSHYVYIHHDPRTKEAVYIGAGTGGRAWSVTHTSRSPAHARWARKLMDDGFSPDQFVRVVRRGMSKTVAHGYESKLLARSSRPRFNLPQGPYKKNEEAWGEGTQKLTAARAMRAAGESYDSIARRLSTSAMTVWRNLKKRT